MMSPYKVFNDFRLQVVAFLAQTTTKYSIVLKFTNLVHDLTGPSLRSLFLGFLTKPLPRDEVKKSGAMEIRVARSTKTIRPCPVNIRGVASCDLDTQCNLTGTGTRLATIRNSSSRRVQTHAKVYKSMLTREI